jgi:hypothetical protein
MAALICPVAIPSKPLTPLTFLVSSSLSKVQEIRKKEREMVYESLKASSSFDRGKRLQSCAGAQKEIFFVLRIENLTALCIFIRFQSDATCCRYLYSVFGILILNENDYSVFNSDTFMVMIKGSHMYQTLRAAKFLSAMLLKPYST